MATRKPKPLDLEKVSPSCGGCKHLHRIEAGGVYWYECRRFPPTLLHDEEEGPYHRYPQLDRSTPACGEFKGKQ